MAVVIQQRIKKTVQQTHTHMYIYSSIPMTKKAIEAIHCSHFSLAYLHQTAQVIYHSLASLSVSRHQ